MFDLIIHHHGSLSGHRLEYIGGDIMEIQQLDADKFANWDITNVLEGYLGYRYNDIPAMYYKYDNQSNEDIHSLNSNRDYENMITVIINGHRKTLHMFVDHEEENQLNRSRLKWWPQCCFSLRLLQRWRFNILRMMCQNTVHSQRSSLLYSQYSSLLYIQHSSLPGSLYGSLLGNLRGSQSGSQHSSPHNSSLKMRMRMMMMRTLS
jgi:hypothetical protein